MVMSLRIGATVDTRNDLSEIFWAVADHGCGTVVLARLDAVHN
jgi:hypothetical protein